MPHRKRKSRLLEIGTLQSLSSNANEEKSPFVLGVKSTFIVLSICQFIFQVSTASIHQADYLELCPIKIDADNRISQS